MSHTNSTANLSLPQFIGTDKPTWLGDINGAFSAIDAYAGTNDAAVSAAASDASSAISQAVAAVNTANTANTTAGNASTTANNAIGVANTANAIAGTVDAKVGLLADLTTTDRTSIVNAINEVNGAIGTPSASQVSYDNTGSGLTAANVQDAIDELAQGGAQATVRYYNGYIQYFDGNNWINFINTETPQQILPFMSSNTDLFGTVTCNQTGYESTAYQAIDGGSGSVRMGGADTYVEFSFTNTQYLSTIKCTACSASDASAASDIYLEYSADGNTWVVAHSDTIAQNDTTPDVYSGVINNTVKAIRIHKPNNPGAFVLTHIEAYN